MVTNVAAEYPDVFTDDQVKTKLSKGIHEVTFVKKDGTNRTLLCTRDPVFIPKELRESVTETKKKKQSSAIAVWAVDECFWRSFNGYQVKTIEKAS